MPGKVPPGCTDPAAGTVPLSALPTSELAAESAVCIWGDERAPVCDWPGLRMLLPSLGLVAVMLGPSWWEAAAS